MKRIFDSIRFDLIFIIITCCFYCTILTTRISSNFPFASPPTLSRTSRRRRQEGEGERRHRSGGGCGCRQGQGQGRRHGPGQRQAGHRKWRHSWWLVGRQRQRLCFRQQPEQRQRHDGPPHQPCSGPSWWSLQHPALLRYRGILVGCCERFVNWEWRWIKLYMGGNFGAWKDVINMDTVKCSL